MPEWIREVDDRGQVWVWARNVDLDVVHRFPDEPGVAEGLAARGWEPSGAPVEEEPEESAAVEAQVEEQSKSKSSKKSTPAVDTADEPPKE